MQELKFSPDENTLCPRCEIPLTDIRTRQTPVLKWSSFHCPDCGYPNLPADMDLQPKRRETCE